MIIGRPYSESEHALLEARDNLRHAVQWLFVPAPVVVGAELAIVGSMGDRAYAEVRRLLSTIAKLEYDIRYKAVMAKRYDPERIERNRNKYMPRLELEPFTAMTCDEFIYQHRIMEDG